MPCKLPDCPIDKGGPCLEGRESGCPNLLPQEPMPTAVYLEAATPEPKPSSSRENLYSGNRLEIDEARAFSRRGRAVVVALVGLIECGKTSLIARLHQQFMAGPIAGYRFAGSRTLLGFEEMNWLATIESGVGRPQMDRTSRRFDNSFLHFTVRASDGEPEPTDVLINDISGDTVQDAIAVQSVCEGLLGLARADHVAVVVDGAALADFEVCYDHVAKVRSFVQRIVQSGQIGPHTALHLVISKQDSLNPAEALASRVEEEFTRLFAPKVGAVECWRVAARPCDGSEPTEAEIARLFFRWVSTSFRYPSSDLSTLGQTEWERDFCRFGASSDPRLA